MLAGRTRVGGPERADPSGPTQESNEAAQALIDLCAFWQQHVSEKACAAGRTRVGGPKRADPSGPTQEGDEAAQALMEACLFRWKNTHRCACLTVPRDVPSLRGHEL